MLSLCAASARPFAVLEESTHMLEHLLHHLEFTDAVKTVDSGITQQPFLLADGFPDFNLPKTPEVVTRVLSPTVKAAEKEAVLLVKGDLDELKGSIDKLKYTIAAVWIVTGAMWFDLKQGIAALQDPKPWPKPWPQAWPW